MKLVPWNGHKVKDPDKFEGKVLYRFWDIRPTSSYHDISEIRLERIPVIMETECTYFIEDDRRYGGERMIRKNALRSYAFDTIEKAWQNFRVRKQRQFGYVTATYRHVNNIVGQLKGYEEAHGL